MIERYKADCPDTLFHISYDEMHDYPPFQRWVCGTCSQPIALWVSARYDGIQVPAYPDGKYDGDPRPSIEANERLAREVGAR